MEFKVFRRVLTRIVEERLLRILVVPTTDWLGHPFPSRLHHIFERIAEHHAVHVLRFEFYPEKKLETNLIVHEIDDSQHKNLGLYYVANAHKHFSAVYKIARENSIDAVVISNLLSGFMAAKAASGKFKTVFDLSDHFPSSGAGYYFDLDSFVGKLATSFLEKLLKSTLKGVDSTVACSHALQDYVKNLGIRNTCTIPNGVDDFFFSKADGSEIRHKCGLDGSVTVGYIGSIEFWTNLFPLLKAIQRLNSNNNVKLLLIGSGLRTEMAQQVYQKIESLNIKKNVVWLDFIPYSEVPKYVAAMDICTIPFNRHHPTAYYSAPNKLLEYFALGKPVISAPLPEVELIAKDYVNFAVNSDEYVDAIKTYIANPDGYKQLGEQGRRLAAELTWTKISERYEHLLTKIAA
jgi:glycosyltransferase involved in cell wall biosynthesis